MRIASRVRAARSANGMPTASNSSAQPADADAEQEAAVGKHVERGRRLGHRHRVAQRQDEDAGAELDAAWCTRRRRRARRRGRAAPPSRRRGTCRRPSTDTACASRSGTARCSGIHTDSNPSASALRATSASTSGRAVEPQPTACNANFMAAAIRGARGRATRAGCPDRACPLINIGREERQGRQAAPLGALGVLCGQSNR